MVSIRSHSPAHTLAIGKHIGERLNAGSMVTLSGTLGAGKTWMAKGIAYGLGVPDYEYVNSPAYDLIHEYRGRIPVFHLDLYRLGTLSLDDEMMVQEVLSQPGVCLIEWPERLANYPGLQRGHQLGIQIDLADDDDSVRIINLAPRGAQLYDSIVHSLITVFS